MASVRALHWFRSDLRVRDNTALRAAATRAERLACVFVLRSALARERGRAARALPARLRATARAGARAARLASCSCARGDPATEIARLARELRAELVTWNRDYGPYARARDAAVERDARRAAACASRPSRTASSSRPTRSARARANPTRCTPRIGARGGSASARRAAEPRAAREAPAARRRSLDAGRDAGARPRARRDAHSRRRAAPPPSVGSDAFLERRVADYAWHRDLPAVDGTSRLSPYLRFGTISVRTCLRARARSRARRPAARAGRREVGGRAGLARVLPRDPRRASARAARRVPARARRARLGGRRRGLRAWCEGRTGYPFVDAAMRQLAATGWMHNRARMIVASFLSKDLLIDWRHGERYFMQQLVDGDPASNNGGWQWAASTGTDAQPYFRIFNPGRAGRALRSGRRLRAALGAGAARRSPARARTGRGRARSRRPDYPAPIVDHAARARCARSRAIASRARARGRAMTPRWLARRRAAAHRRLGVPARPRGALRRRPQARPLPRPTCSAPTSSGCRSVPRSRSAWACRARRSGSSSATTGCT